MKKLSILSLAASVIGGGVLLYLLLAMLGITNDFLSWDARQAGVLWKMLAGGFLFVAVFQIYMLINLKVEGIGAVAILGLLIALSVASATGFKGTAGDIKQRISAFNNLGKVVDTDVLFNCYEEFYHFNSNPDLKKYVLEYGELPGRNLYNAYIRSGEEPKSKAPRADEDFKWHTGSYEAAIPKDCGK